MTRYSDGPEAVYAIAPEQQLDAAYYRNTVIHFFVTSSIAELALLGASEVRDTPPEIAFWNAAVELRNLLKFEFFFSEKEAFRGELLHELAIQDSDWQRRLAARAPRVASSSCAACGPSTPTGCCGPSSKPTAWSATTSSAGTARRPSTRRSSSANASAWAASTTFSSGSRARPPFRR